MKKVIICKGTFLGIPYGVEKQGQVDDDTFISYMGEQDVIYNKICLDYCWHRLTKHDWSGIHGWVPKKWVDESRKMLRRSLK